MSHYEVDLILSGLSETGSRIAGVCVTAATSVAGRVVVIVSEAGARVAGRYVRVLVGVITVAGTGVSDVRSRVRRRVVGRRNDGRCDYGRRRVDRRSGDHRWTVRGVDGATHLALAALHAHEDNAREEQNHEDHSKNPASDHGPRRWFS